MRLGGAKIKQGRGGEYDMPRMVTKAYKHYTYLAALFVVNVSLMVLEGVLCTLDRFY